MRFKSLIVAGFAAGIALTTTGCDPATTTGQPTQPGQTIAPGGSVPGTIASPVTDSPDSDPTTTVASGTPKCVSAQLTLDKGHGGQVGGTWFLRFINHSVRTCVMQGFPGVSQTNGATGDPIGEPAVRDSGPDAPASAPVTLAPGGSAQFEFITYPKQVNECAALRTNTLRVYPPDNTESFWLPWDSLICPSPQRMLVVRAVTPM